MALKPEDMDFISNFSTLWAVFLGALLATIGGFGATQLEWILERRRRERNAAIFFGELLTTLNIILTIAGETRQIGDPYGPITLRLLRSAVKEVEIYNRNRETLFDLRDAEMRARIHTLVLRIVMPADGVFDASNEIANVELQLKTTNLDETTRMHLAARLAKLEEGRVSAFDTVLESSELLKSVVKQLEPIAKYSYENLDKVVRNA
ncbi:MAG TPA: hypothetical protein VNU97_04130 [Rhizomicrobium sp.]|nr:hypothetical protein [Rhizomicrobium sp.]